MAALPEIENIRPVGVSPEPANKPGSESPLVNVGDLQRVDELEGELAGVLTPINPPAPQSVEHEGEKIAMPFHPDAEGNLTVDLTVEGLKEEKKYPITSAHKWIVEYIGRKIKMVLTHGKRVIFGQQKIGV